MKLLRWIFWMLGIGVAFLLAFYLAHPILLPGYARLFQKHTASKNADAIICLAGGRTTRVAESLRLWSECYSKKLFVTVERARNRQFSQLEISHLKFAQEATKMMKLDAKWEILPSLTRGATSTFDEAEDALSYAKEKNWERIIIVTDEFHTRRAHYAFEKIFTNSGIKVEVAGASNEVFSTSNWWKSDVGILSYLGESIKFPIYLLWNSELKIVENK